MSDQYILYFNKIIIIVTYMLYLCCITFRSTIKVQILLFSKLLAGKLFVPCLMNHDSYCSAYCEGVFFSSVLHLKSKVSLPTVLIIQLRNV